MEQVSTILEMDTSLGCSDMVSMGLQMCVFSDPDPDPNPCPNATDDIEDLKDFLEDCGDLSPTCDLQLREEDFTEINIPTTPEIVTENGDEHITSDLVDGNLKEEEELRQTDQTDDVPKEYVVEAIRAKKYEKGTTYFLVKWENWDETDNTWEPKGHLKGCQELVEEFMLRQKTPQNCSRPTPTSSKSKSDSQFAPKTSGSRGRPRKPKIQVTPNDSTPVTTRERKKRKRNSEVLIGDVEEPKKEFNENEALEQDRSFIEFDIISKIKHGRIPQRLVHVTARDGNLFYIVQWKNPNSNGDDDIEEVSIENTSVIKADIFRTQFPHLVISFYESRLDLVAAPDDDIIAERACEALAKHKERMPIVEKDMDINTNKKRLDIFGLPENLESSSDGD